MSANNIDSLLIEYNQKRIKAELDAENRKLNIYKVHPKIDEIDSRINQVSIDKAKAILKGIDNLSQFDDEIALLNKQKCDYLRNNHISSDDFEPKYDCKICNDSGYIKNANQKIVMCNCLKQRLLDISYNNSNLVNIKKENFDNFNINIFSDKVDINKYKIKCSPRQNIENIKNASIKFIDNFDSFEEKNLLFTGNTGLGKTYMSNCIANEVLKMGKTVLYQTAPILLETIIDHKFNKYKNHNTDAFYKSVLSTDLLIIDDLGAENSNSLIISELFTLINSRALNLSSKPTKTIISTNLSIEKIFKLYEERIGSRIAGYYNIYRFFGEDLRLHV